MIPVLQPAETGLRQGWRAAVVVILLAAAGWGMLLPARSLAHRGPADRPAIVLPELAEAGSALRWTAGAQGPATTQDKTLLEMLKLLAGLAWAGCAVAAFSVFSTLSARAHGRAGEIGIRRAVGASLRQVVLTLLFEAGVLAAFALIGGVALAGVLRALALHWWPGAVLALGRAGPVPALSLCALLGAACLSPLWLVRSRHLVAPAEDQVGLKIPAVQVACSIALLLAAAALLSVGRPERTSGSEAGHGWVYQLDAGIAEPGARAARLAGLLDRIEAVPGVGLASLASPGALLGLGTVDLITTDCGRCFSGGILLRWPNFAAVTHGVSPDSFRTGAIRLLSGRVLTRDDAAGAVRVAVVNRALALRYFQRGEAVGRDLYLGPGWPGTPYRVVGIVADERSAALGGALQPRETVYLSVFQHPPQNLELLIRPDAAERALPSAAELRRLLGAAVVLSGDRSETAYRGIQRQAIRWFGVGFGIAALLVLGMALVGTFFTTRAWLASVAWELGLRRAVGARRRHAGALVLLRALGVAAGGTTLGLFLYGAILAPALSTSLALPTLAVPNRLAFLAIAPVLLTILIAVLPAMGMLRDPPGRLLHRD